MSPRLHCLLTVSLLTVSAAVLAAGPPLVWRGDITTARGVINGVAKAWQQAGHDKIELQSFNTVSGIDAVIAGTADLAGSARPDAPGRPGESALVFTPVAWDALVMVTHPRNPVGSLSLKQLHDIYYGKITNWSEVGGKNEPIHLYAVASPTDGVEFSLRRLLFGRGNQPVAAPRLYVNVAKLEEAITLDPKALGVSTMAGVRGNSKLKMLSIDGKQPSAANVADGSYPLYTPLYLVTRKDGPKAAEVEQFIDFLKGPKAASVMRSNLLLPYADGAGLAAREGQRLASIAAEVGSRPASSTPIAAPGATYASRSANAPTSTRTLEARQSLQQKREADKVAATAATAKARFDAVQGTATSTARPGFGTVDASATTVSAQHAAGDFGKVEGSATTVPARAAATAGGAVRNGNDSVSTYKVVPGDTLWSIAQKHDVSVDDMRAWNGLAGNAVKVGQTLRLQASR